MGVVNRSGEVGALRGGVSVFGVGVKGMGSGAEDWRFATEDRCEGSSPEFGKYMGRPVTGEWLESLARSCWGEYGTPGEKVTGG